MTASAAPNAPADPRRWSALALIALAQFVVIMDTSIIGVALPRMQADLGFSQENLSWVFNAYVVAFGGLLLLGGRLSDLLGARRLFSAGWVVLAAGSLTAGLAGEVWVELTGRALQGVGAALIAPSALTLLMTLFGSRPQELGKAFALYGAAAPAGGTAGVFLGGVITQYASWPWVFYINIPVALVVLIATPAVMPSGAGRRGSIDLAGAVTVTAGLAAGVYAIVRAPETGWGSAETWLVLLAGVVLIAAFVAIQAKRREPLMRLGIWRAPNLAGANIAQLLMAAAWIPMWFFLNLYLQQVLGLDAFASGSALLPMTVAIMIMMIVLAPRLISRFGPKPLIVLGLFALGAGMFWLSLARPDGNFLVDVLPASLLSAVGMSLAFIPSLGTALSSARPEEGGLASGIVNTSYQVGSALGLAAMTAIAAAHGAREPGDPVALTDGFSAAFLGAAALAVIGGLAALLTLRTAPAAEGAGDGDGEGSSGRPEKAAA
ncbi:MFS transporter [Streptomyces sp. NBC_00257]|uniref:MFS transporter n=1 Tax=unclassified Streptomyces TaxID=2593676 RepID=UPI002250FA95|nr:MULTISPECIES: MFS transporter [unclassified Streptomyces]WTB54030.1 MFS transporter [Streptomyces sp. NBC_00826]WTH93080.1 MFS transporter [Streptomyces sp. NBC_00825]WTI01812.1 MFS transporter [Streptomyces sp. NBC_00822]MCX4867433.1 MFS transporter [Streptomyces sp. NBC_00906]MCX4898671.1 MFS transporter [Streptomyces sp. NBC_00892]